MATTRSRSRFFAAALCASVAAWLPGAAGWARSASAAPVKLDTVEPRILRHEFTAFLREIDIDEDQRLVVEMLYRDYEEAITMLAEHLETRTLEAGRERVEDALAGEIIMEPQELRRMRAAVLEEYASGWDEAERLARELLDDVRSVLQDDEEAAYARAGRELRRAMYLRPRRAGEAQQEYAGDGLDVIELAAGAMLAGGELVKVEHAKVEEVLEPFSVELDAVLVATATTAHRARHERAVAGILRDDEAMRRAETSILETWRRLDLVNTHAIERIAALASGAGGESSSARWRRRCREATFPWLYRTTQSDLEHDWIVDHVTDPASRQRADEVHARYLVERDRLRDEAALLILRGRRTLDVIVHPSVDGARLEGAEARKLHEELLRHSGRRSTLDKDVSSALLAILSDRERKQMAADVAARRG